MKAIKILFNISIAANNKINIGHKFRSLSFFLLLFVLHSFSSFGQITRTQIISNAIPYTNNTWTATSCNLVNGTLCNGRNVYKAPWVVVGTNTGMPYCWGDWSTLTEHTTAMTNCKSAGDVCGNNGGSCSGLAGAGDGCSSGHDCSGFVSRAWGLTSKYGTAGLPSISTAYSSLSQVKPGDIFNKSGSHVRLVEANYGNGNYRVIEASGTDWKVNYHSYTASQLAYYSPRYKTNVSQIPANDNCSNAQPLVSNTSCVSMSGSVAYATASGLTKPSCDATSSPLNDVWYSFQATGSSHTITVTPSVGLNAVISLYTSCNGVQIGCSNTGGNGITETINATSLTAGTTYYVRIYSSGSAAPSTNTFNICLVGQYTSCGTPTGLTSGLVSSSSATLSWDQVSGVTSYKIIYKSATSSTWVSTTSLATSKYINGLNASTSYEFQVQAICSSAGSFSTSSNFTTAPASPSNDNCANAQTLFPNTSCISTQGNVAAATASGLIKASCDASSSGQLADVWYKFQATTSSPKIIVTPSTGLNTVVSLYTSCSGGQIKCSNTGGIGGTETISAAGLTVGTIYYIRVYSYSNTIPSTTTFNICITTSTAQFRTDEDAATGIDNFTNQILDLKVFPNPIDENSNITYYLPQSQLVTIVLIDIFGKQIILKNQNQNEGNNSLLLNTKELNLARGMYFLHITAGNKHSVAKLLVN